MRTSAAVAALALLLAPTAGSASRLSSRLKLLAPDEGLAPPAVAPPRVESGVPPLRLAAAEWGVGAGAAAVSVPVGLLLSTALGGTTNSLFLSGIPALLLFLALPPLAVAWSEWMAEGWLIGSGARFGLPFWATLGAHLVAFAVGVSLGVWSAELPGAALFTVGEVLALPTAATLVLHLTRGGPAPAAAPPAAPPQPPAASAFRRSEPLPLAMVVPLLRGAF